MIKYYVTKYALTEGIWEVDARDAQEDGVYLYLGVPGRLRVQVLEKDWFLSKENAVKRVEQLRDAKIKSMEKTIARVRDMDVHSSKPWLNPLRSEE